MNPLAKSFPASVIAKAAGLSKSTAVRQAIRQRWRRQRVGNAFHFSPPRSLIAKCRRLVGETRSKPAASLLQSDSLSLAKTLARGLAVLELQLRVASGVPMERALLEATRAVSFRASPSSLRRWAARYSTAGISGLLERKAGRSGRKPTKAEANL